MRDCSFHDIALWLVKWTLPVFIHSQLWMYQQIIFTLDMIGPKWEEGWKKKFYIKVRRRTSQVAQNFSEFVNMLACLSCCDMPVQDCSDGCADKNIFWSFFKFSEKKQKQNQAPILDIFSHFQICWFLKVCF